VVAASRRPPGLVVERSHPEAVPEFLRQISWHPFRVPIISTFRNPVVCATLRPPATSLQPFGLFVRKTSNIHRKLVVKADGFHIMAHGLIDAPTEHVESGKRRAVSNSQRVKLKGHGRSALEMQRRTGVINEN